MRISAPDQLGAEVVHDAHREALVSKPLCPSCPAEWLPVPGVVAHKDDCPSLAATATHEPDCRAAATGFCDCLNPAITSP